MCLLRASGVKVAATREGVTITSDNPDLGEVREEIEAEYNSEPLAIGFNPKLSIASCIQRVPRRSWTCSLATIAALERAPARVTSGCRIQAW